MVFSDNIPSKILKICSEASTDVLYNLSNDMLKPVNFPDNFKLVEITPGFKKKILCIK